MGYNTYLSLGRILPNRTHVVLTHQKINLPDEVIQFNNLEDLLKYIEDKNVFIIGGASVYKLFINKADNLYLTEIDATHEADVYFPKFDKKIFDKDILGKNNDNGISYQFTLYKRR